MWINIPNEIVKGFTGKPIRSQKYDADLEAMFKPIKCPANACAFSASIIKDFNAHITSEHDLNPAKIEVMLDPEMEDSTTAKLIMFILIRLMQTGQENPLVLIHKTSDSLHSGEVWRRVGPLMDKPAGGVLRLKDKQYEWLRQLLDRQVPWSRVDKERLGDQASEYRQTVAMHIFGLSEDHVKQAVLSLPERRVVEVDPDEGAEEKEMVKGA